MTTLLERYVSFDGRLARLPYFIRGIYVAIAAIVVFFASIPLFAHGSRAAWWAGLVLVVAAIAVIGVGTVSLIVRRLHDLGLPGYHAIWIGVAELGWYFLSDAPGETQLLALPLFAILVWLQFYPGNPADNRYGAA
jgi:uncharacterized membrane protein YhaH (DUF805 family)